jgi:DNA-binding NarL/FixJ family response regulator
MTPLKTYLVEDSAVIRESLIAALEELGPIEVVGTAEDEACAVQWLTQGNQFDLVIVDIFLKGGSGLGVLRAANALAPRRMSGVA